ncbi:hypothetical protein A0128_03790 [Leptospira tipperaryensis]|uniref:IgGFc-binding protein N-terminal domain-containing protein n=1 Tax=Leptospira tipperaryensis TaxID=2564040 RepID=A0A1D7UTX3_9LEPT|nr:hypothetical protein [Leptospira tipperaryensis]AOP33059.1 hypothetical protein A0128_03790 [Leptospira tipperaryensis]
MKHFVRVIVMLFLLFSQSVFAENWRESGSFLLPRVPIGNTELGTNIRLITIQNTNSDSSMIGNVALAYVEASTTRNTNLLPIRVKKLSHYNGGGSFSSSLDTWTTIGNAGFTNRGFSFTGYADLEEYNYEIGGTSLTNSILGCFDAPCSNFQTLGAVTTLVPQIEPAFAYPNEKSNTDMISTETHDYFAYPDQTQGGRVTVVRREHSSGPLTSGAWEVVAQPGFSGPGTIAHIRLAYKRGNEIRVVVATDNGSLSAIQVFRLSRIQIMGMPPFSLWMQEGNAISVSHVIMSEPSIPNFKYYAHPDLEIDNNGIPHLLFTRMTTASEGGRIQSTVRILSGNTWVDFVDPFIGNLSSEDNVCTDMTFDTITNKLFVGCVNVTHLRPMVKTLSGFLISRWTTLGDILSEAGNKTACIPFFPPADTGITYDRGTNALFFAYSSCGGTTSNVSNVRVVAKDLD